MAVSMGEASGKLTLNAKPFFDSIKSATAGLGDFNKKTEETNVKLKKTETQTEKTGTKFDGFKDKVSKTTAKIKSASDNLQKFGSNLKGIGKSLGDTGKKMTTHITLPVAAAGAALVKSAVSSYSQTEQLIGGVDTLFKKSSKMVQKNADEAYKTAGMSANKYMETITGFSASLIKSLGGDTKKAAKIGDMAIKDMSDNANKFGTDIGSIQYAYQGFAKQNYTMLDNLKLGYGGTASEMAKLLLEHGKLTKAQRADLQKAVKSGKNINQELGKIGFAKQIEAIHNVQKELDVTGTTSKEAAKTIEGSTNSMKSAWENLTSAMATGDYDQELENFKKTFRTFMDNIKPVIKTTLESIGEGLPGMLAPIMSAALSPFPKLQEKFDKLDEDEQGAIATSTLFAAVFAGPVLSALSSIITIIGSTVTGIGKLISAFKKLKESKFLSDFFTSSHKIFDDLRQDVTDYSGDVSTKIGKAFATAGVVIAAAIAGWEIGTQIKSKLDEEIGFQDLWNDGMDEIIQSWNDNYDSYMETFQGIGSELYTWVHDDFIGQFEEVGADLFDKVDKSVENHRKDFEGAGAAIYDDVDLGFESATKGAEEFGAKVFDKTDAGFTKYKTTFEGIGSKTYDWIHNKTKKLSEGFSDVATTIKDKLSQGIDSYQKFFEDLGAKIFDWIDGGIASSAKKADKSLQNFGSWLYDKTHSHATGLDYVPYDGYQAILHKGERVMTKQENAAYSKGNGTNSNGNTFNFYSPKAISEAEAARQFKKVQRDLALGF